MFVRASALSIEEHRIDDPPLAKQNTNRPAMRWSNYAKKQFLRV